ncbi:hypothetical protein J5X84_16335 [Streptosporangiaceae bacterium NEAU-GS5]|nr:hypothetical protein [Streptosporangiaceae bacterium NEAU-GS5]
MVAALVLAAGALYFVWSMVGGRSAPTPEARPPVRGTAITADEPAGATDAIPTGAIPTDVAASAGPLGAGTTGGPDAEAARQAGAVDDLLADSSLARSRLNPAIAAASACRASGLSDLGDVTADRRDQLARARALDTGALPDGLALKQALTEALGASYDADEAFLTWARRHLGGGCTGSVEDDADYQRGLARSGDAQRAKGRAIEAWTPIAAQFGRKGWQANQI